MPADEGRFSAMATVPTVVAGPEQMGAAEGPYRQFVRRLARNRTALVALAFIVIAAVLVIAAPFIAPYDPLQQDLRSTLQSPSGDHWFGTDDLGRDVLSRILHAGRISLFAALIA